MFIGHLRVTGPGIFPKLADAWIHRVRPYWLYAELGILIKMFEARLAGGHKAFAVMEDEAILTAALRAGINLTHLCRRGTCGACRAAVEKGEVKQDLFRPSALSHHDRLAGQVLLCCARALSDVVLNASEMERLPDAPRRIPARVISIDRCSSEVAILTLRAPPIEPFDYTPGQYIGIVGKDGFARAFSIANSPRRDRTIELHIGRIRNGIVTNHVYEKLQVGDVIRIEVPQGANFLPDDTENSLIAIVGGTGYAPIQAILQDWIDRGVKKSVHLYWGSRMPSGFYALRAAEALIAQFPNSTFTPIVSSVNLEDGWRGRRGLVHLAALADFPDLSKTEVFVCGPPGLIDAAERDCAASGLSADRFFADAFSIVKPANELEVSCLP